MYLSHILTWIIDETRLNQLLAGMPTWLLVLMIGVCIIVLSKGADWLVEGVVQLASRTGLPRIVIGATIVSLGTTTPEAVVSVTAAWMGSSGLALGNGVGSIIADTGLIFGLTCILTRVPVNRYILDRTGWIQVAAATLLVIIALTALVKTPVMPLLHRWVGFLFLALLGGYLYLSYLWARKGLRLARQGETATATTAGVPWALMLTLGGLFLVVLGARILVPTAAEVAQRLGVPEDVVAATMVALGTSLPELMTALAAIRRGHPEIMVGNVVGADVLNCLFVIGAAAAARPLQVPTNFYTFHFPAMIMILYSFRIFIMINRDNWFKRWQGFWLLGVYGVYIVLQYTLNVGQVH
jgi:cation:H+ antiporter